MVTWLAGELRGIRSQRGFLITGKAWDVLVKRLKVWPELVGRTEDQLRPWF